MTQFEIWKLVTDFGLLGSLIFFAYRFLRSQVPVDTNRLQELQNGLRHAIREADQAGKGLNEQLVQRKQNLEKILIELEGVESRINKVINTADEIRGDLQFEITKAKQIQTQNVQHIKTNPAPKEDLLAVDKDIRNELTISMNEFSEAVNPTVRTNIFGEPIVEVESTYDPVIRKPIKDLEKAFGNTPLTVKIEKEVEQVIPAAAAKSPTLSLEEVYAEAEDLLRAGRAIEEVSKETHLTSDEVRMLSQMVESDAQQEELKNINTQDERLGVLSGFKRQTEVL